MTLLFQADLSRSLFFQSVHAVETVQWTFLPCVLLPQHASDSFAFFWFGVSFITHLRTPSAEASRPASSDCASLGGSCLLWKVIPLRSKVSMGCFQIFNLEVICMLGAYNTRMLHLWALLAVLSSDSFVVCCCIKAKRMFQHFH